MMHASHQNAGFTLLITLILTSVTLALGVALLDVAVKQIVLSANARQSQYAFYNADSALECALYWDQRFNAFAYDAPLPGNSIACDQQQVGSYASSISGSRRTTTFTTTCTDGGTKASVTIYKESSGQTNLYANGFSSCSLTDPRRVERGIKARY